MADDLHFSGYENWVENEGLPVYSGWGIHPPDLELAPWDRKGSTPRSSIWKPWATIATTS